jgi:hypothetical protein
MTVISEREERGECQRFVRFLDLFNLNAFFAASDAKIHLNMTSANPRYLHFDDAGQGSGRGNLDGGRISRWLLPAF